MVGIATEYRSELLLLLKMQLDGFGNKLFKSKF